MKFFSVIKGLQEGINKNSSKGTQLALTGAGQEFEKITNNFRDELKIIPWQFEAFRF